DPTCANGPSDANLCGLDNPVGAPQIISEAGEFATLLARRFGDRVDEWGTVNEPVNYLLSAYGVGSFPPGKALILSEDTFKTGFATALATYTKMHAAIYHAIKTEDTEDADKDGSKADVGLPLSVGTWVPARDNALSTNPDDIKARDRMEYIYNHLFVDALRSGSLDTNFDGTPDTDIPGLEGTIDWLGVQYYFRTGVSSQNAVVASLGIAPCLSTFDFGACVPPANEDTTKCVPAMKYEFYEQGLYEVLKDFSTRWKGLPLLVTESGIATETGRRRAEHVVRSLEQIQRARNDGVDVRGYYHWSLYDNFEWALGYVPRFGLYSVDFTTYERTPTEGATIYSAVAKARTITTQQHKEFGGTGPMTPESGATSAARCNL
ncbi:MAG: family 1 glycosylhydrolase, partial [Acidimicrobiia bacterium]